MSTLCLRKCKTLVLALYHICHKKLSNTKTVFRMHSTCTNLAFSHWLQRCKRNTSSREQGKRGRKKLNDYFIAERRIIRKKASRWTQVTSAKIKGCLKQLKTISFLDTLKTYDASVPSSVRSLKLLNQNLWYTTEKTEQSSPKAQIKCLSLKVF